MSKSKKPTEKEEIAAAKLLANRLEKNMPNNSVLNPIRRKLVKSLRDKKPKDFKAWNPKK